MKEETYEKETSSEDDWCADGSNADMRMRFAGA